MRLTPAYRYQYLSPLNGLLARYVQHGTCPIPSLPTPIRVLSLPLLQAELALLTRVTGSSALALSASAGSPAAKSRVITNLTYAAAKGLWPSRALNASGSLRHRLLTSGVEDALIRDTLIRFIER
jgi:hypothetical protein